VSACRDDAARAYLVKYCDNPGLEIEPFVGHYLDQAVPGKSERRDGAYFVGVVESGKHLTLIDPGASPTDPRIKNGTLTNYVDPVKSLAGAGWKATAVTEIVLTHVQWNSMGNLTRFPNATVYVQQEEYDFLNWEAGKRRLDGLEAKGALVKLEEDDEIYPGLRVRGGGKITTGNQVVVVDLPRRTAVFMGPLAPFYDNISLDSGPTTGFTRHGASKMIRKLKAENLLLVPYRDPQVASRFKKIREGVWEIK